MRTRCIIVALLTWLTVGCTPASADNPFFKPSDLPYQAPPFQLIHDSDYQPAIEEGMRVQLQEVGRIANDAHAPTFDNTIVAMERTGDLLTRVSKVFFAMAGANTNPTIQKVEEEEAPKLAAHQDEIYLNHKLFERVRSLYDRRKDLGLDPDSLHLLERYYRNFVRAGANLSAADQTKLRALNKEEATLSTQFHQHVLADTAASAVVVEDKAQLDGLTDADVAAAAQAARERGLAGKWVLSLQNTTRQPVLVFLKNRALRQRVLEASEMRCSHGGKNDNRAIISRLAQLRAQKAKLLGFDSAAAYLLDDQMARTPQAALKLLTDMVAGATAKARAEAAMLQKVVDAEHGGFTVGAADWEQYAEKVRKASYDIDVAETRPYFEMNRVLEDGVFYAANQMYGLTFKERTDIPKYHPDARVFEVFDADGSPLALWYCDYFARPGRKSGGAWMDSFVDQNGLSGAKPVVFNECNFTKPAPGQPALLTVTDVTTMFHEFGHALHGMLSRVKYPSLAGTNVPRDFVEFPSQFNEHWALEPSVFAHYARHYQSGKEMPAALVERIRKSRKFNQGYDTTEYLAAALLDLSWHTVAPDAPLQDAGRFEPEALRRFAIDLPQVPPRYRSDYFSHIWDGGYDAGYYAYLWSEVLDDDAYYWFKEHGGMTRANGQRFRDMILSRGQTRDVAELFREFRGRDPIVEPLLIERGLKPEPVHDPEI